MEKKPKFGVVLYHLKGKLAFGSTNGNAMTEFKFNESQKWALLDYLEKGVFEGMFDIVSYNDFLNVLSLHCDSLKLESEFDKRKKELDDAYKIHIKAQNENQPQ